jgi:DNA-binding Lrp family transcriptional regulator
MEAVTLDSIDKKILYHLSENSRLTNKELASLIKSNKNTVKYRIDKLIQNKIIKKFMCVYDISRIGLRAYKIYIRLGGLTKENEKKIYDYLEKEKRINWYAKSSGAWDLFVSIIAEDISELIELKEDLLSKFGKFIEAYSISILEDAIVLNKDYLLDSNTSYRKSIKFSQEKSSKVEIDNIDLKIMYAISNDARYQIVELSNRLNLNVRTIINRIKSLRDLGILQGSIAVIDLKKMGFQFSKITIYLKDFKKKDFYELIEHSKSINNVVHILKNLGEWELELEVETKSIDEVYEIMKNLRNKFNTIIKKIEHSVILEHPKWNLLPELDYIKNCNKKD